MGNPAHIEKVIRCEIEMLEGSGRDTRDYGMSPPARHLQGIPASLKASRIITIECSSWVLAVWLGSFSNTPRLQQKIISKSSKLCKFGLCFLCVWQPPIVVLDVSSMASTGNHKPQPLDLTWRGMLRWPFRLGSSLHLWHHWSWSGARIAGWSSIFFWSFCIGYLGVIMGII